MRANPKPREDIKNDPPGGEGQIGKTNEMEMYSTPSVCVQQGVVYATGGSVLGMTPNGIDRGIGADPIADILAHARKQKQQRPRFTEADIIREFEAQMIGAGIEPPRNLITDGKLHRCDCSGDRQRGKNNAAYQLYIGTTRAGIPYARGGYQNWRSGSDWVTLKFDNGLEFDAQERAAIDAKMAQAAAEHEAEKHRRQAEARDRAAKELANSTPLSDDHEYLVRKGVRAHGLTADGNAIIVPMRDVAGTLHNRQKIGPDGTKKYLYGGLKDGCFHVLGTITDRMVIAEGFATAATIHEATNLPVVVAFDAGNLPKVAAALRKHYPAAKIAIAGDDDWKSTRQDGTPHNAGRIKAIEAAHAVGGIPIFPEFGPFREDKQTDFNDLAAELGNAAVRALFKDFIEIIAPPPKPPEDIPEEGQGPEGITLEDFRAYMPMGQFIYTPTRELWPAKSVDAKIRPLPLLGDSGEQLLDENGKPRKISASGWLARHQSVEQMTWAPGNPMLIRDRFILGGGWIPRKDVTCFNLYLKPNLRLGDASKATKWIDHIKFVYGDDAAHLIKWFAFRVQSPSVKINHAIVLGGAQGIGKDTMLEPVKRAVGPWNCQEATPQMLLGRFNGFVKSVILRINEARDLGKEDRFAFYEHMKIYTAAPPDVIRVDEKHVREYYVPNVSGVVITTNHKTNGIYLPADDRRHFVAWSDLKKEDFKEEYWTDFWNWYDVRGGASDVAAYLTELDISDFNPKAPPPQTEAFWAIVDAHRPEEEAEIADLLDNLKNPHAVTIAMVAAGANHTFQEWLNDRKNWKAIAHRFETVGYVPVRNPDAKDGLWRIGGKRQTVYANSDLSLSERMAAAQALR